MSDDHEQLFEAVEEALIEGASAPIEDAQQFFTMEALHQLSHTLGDLYHEECMAALDAIDEFETEDEARVYIAQFLREQRARFEQWLFDHKLPWVQFYCEHITGVMLMWNIEAKDNR